ncbi:MAG: hypothetical protein KA712_07545 [Myxococcales bacterium]|nr:hypothetical protein [Myxococcales bacterium]
MSADDEIFAQRRAEVLRLTYAEGLGIRAIARNLKMARKTVRQLLDGDRSHKLRLSGAPRAHLLNPFDGGHSADSAGDHLICVPRRCWSAFG